MIRAVLGGPHPRNKLELSFYELETEERQRDEKGSELANSDTSASGDLLSLSRGRKGTAGIGNEVLKSDEWSTVIREIGDDSFRVDERNERASFGRVLFARKQREKVREINLYGEFIPRKSLRQVPYLLVISTISPTSDSIYLEINVIHFTVLR